MITTICPSGNSNQPTGSGVTNMEFLQQRTSTRNLRLEVGDVPRDDYQRNSLNLLYHSI